MDPATTATDKGQAAADAAGTVTCPQCGAAIAKDPRWVTWCERCDWNVDPAPATDQGDRPSAVKKERADRLGAKLHEEVLLSRLTPAERRRQRSLTFAVAALVHVPGLILFGVAVWTVGFIRPFTAFNVVAGCVLLLLAALLRPRFGRAPRDLPLLDRQQAPTLFAVLDRVCEALDARRVDLVAWDMEFNASTRNFGLTRKRLVTLGVPLWVSLTREERVALLGHEVGHEINGDLRQSAIVSSALLILDALRLMLTPAPGLRRPAGVMYLAEELVRLAFRPLRKVVTLALERLYRSSRRASPRAEYIADEAAARVAGRDAAVDCIDDMLLGRHVVGYLRVLARRRDGSDPWQSLTAESAGWPEKEHERLRRVAKLRGHSVDETHPPTHLRLEALKALPPSTPSVTIGEDENAATEVEAQPVLAYFASRYFTD